MKVRLEDVATRVGVSISTVSRVINGKGAVSEETRAAVLAELERVGYTRPTTLRRRRSGLVGLIVPELTNPVFPLLVQHVEEALAARGFTAVLCTASPVMEENEYVASLLDRDVAGLVFVSGRHANVEADHGRYDELRSAAVPMVMVNGRAPGVSVPCCSTDDAEAARTAVRHLHDLGHRRIGCAMGPPRYVPSRRKLQGFREAMAEMRRLDDGEEAELVAHSLFTVEGGRATAEQLLDRGATALVCGNDLMALGAVRAVRARSMDVPGDVSVVGYDDSPLLSFTDPPLTTMRQAVAAMGRHAVSVLVDEIGGRRAEPRELLFPAELVVRSSTGPCSM